MKTIRDFSSRFDVVLGLSDYSMDAKISVAGVGLGACVIEGHVRLSRKDEGPDAEFSLEFGQRL